MYNNMYNNPYNNYNAYNNIPQFQQPTQQPTQLQNKFNVIPVASFQEVQSYPIGWDGTTSIFLDNANNRIYTKKLNYSGGVDINTYTLNNEPTQVQQYATIEEVNQLKGIINDLLSKIEVKTDEQ